MHSVGAPVVIGPMNGGMEYPPNLRTARQALLGYGVGIARRVSGVLNWIFPGKRRAAMLLVANQRTAEALPPGVCENVVELVENGVDLERWDPTDVVSDASLGDENKAQFIFVGRLVEEKGLEFLLESTALLAESTPCQLHIVGDGPLREHLEAKVQELQIENSVEFHGFKPQQECTKYVDAADALILPTLCDCGGAVVLEAMAMSKPVIATNWGGPADYLDETCGLLVDPADRQTFVENIAEAMQKVADSPRLRERLGLAARERVEESFDWDRKIDSILDIYGQVAHKPAESVELN